MSFVIRICSIVGGVYATSIIINSLLQFIMSFMYPVHIDSQNFQPLQNSNLSTYSDSAFVMDANMRVH